MWSSTPLPASSEANSVLAQPTLHSSGSNHLGEPNQPHKHPRYNAPIACYLLDTIFNKPNSPPPSPMHRGFPKDKAMQIIDQSPTYKQYTLLTIPLEELYHTIKDHGLLYPPSPIAKAANKRDMSKFCEFHNTYGHATMRCRDLKN